MESHISRKTSEIWGTQGSRQGESQEGLSTNYRGAAGGGATGLAGGGTLGWSLAILFLKIFLAMSGQNSLKTPPNAP